LGIQTRQLEGRGLLSFMHLGLICSFNTICETTLGATTPPSLPLPQNGLAGRERSTAYRRNDSRHVPFRLRKQAVLCHLAVFTQIFFAFGL